MLSLTMVMDSDFPFLVIISTSFLILILFKKIFIYLAEPSLSCGMQYL